MTENSGNSKKSSPSQYILKKTLLSGIAEGSSVFLLVFGVLVARGLGPSGYGEFTFALAYCALFAIIIEAGLVTLLTRELSHDEELGKKVLRSGISLQLILIPIVTLLLVISIYIIKPETTTTNVILIMLLAIICRALKTSLRGVLRGTGSFQIEAISMAGERLVLVFLGIVTLTGNWNVLQVVSTFAVLKFIDLVLLMIFIHHRILPLVPIFNIREIRWLIKKLLPFILSMAIWVLYNYIDTVMLGYFKTAREVGEYGVIYQFFEGMIVIPSVLGAVFLPWISHEFKKGNSDIDHAVQQGIRLLIIASAPIVIVSIIAPAEILLIIFGKDFVGASTGLSILLASAPAVFLFWFFRNCLVAIHKTSVLVIISAIGLVINIAGNLYFIPLYGVEGACTTTLITEILIFITTYTVLRKNQVNGPGFKPWIQTIVAGTAMATIMYVSKQYWDWALIGLLPGIILAHLLLCRIGFWTKKERKSLHKWYLAW